MRAAQIVAPQTLRIVSLPDPRPQDLPSGWVLVQVERGCICGSDSPYFLGVHGTPLDPGLSLHECLGTVLASRSPLRSPGDRVLAVPLEQRGFAELFATPAERTVPLPEGRFSNELLMAQPLGTALYALRKLPNLLNWDVAIVGQGPMGLLLAAAARNLGAKRIIGIERIPERLAASERMGTTHRVNPDREDPVAAVARITHGKMADLVIEAVGHQEIALDLAIALARQGGTVLGFGVPDRPNETIPYQDLFFKNLTLIGSVNPEPQVDFPLAMEFIHQGRLDVRPLITHELQFTEAEIQKGFELFTGRRDGAIKVIIHFQ